MKLSVTLYKQVIYLNENFAGFFNETNFLAFRTISLSKPNLKFSRQNNYYRHQREWINFCFHDQENQGHAIILLLYFCAVITLCGISLQLFYSPDCINISLAENL